MWFVQSEERGQVDIAGLLLETSIAESLRTEAQRSLCVSI